MWPGNDERSCTSCLDGQYFNSFYHTDIPIGSCNPAGTQHKVQCKPREILAGTISDVRLCLKSGQMTFAMLHGQFYLTSAVNCGNWWAVRCGMSKSIRCTYQSGSDACQVTKRVSCVEVCKGYRVSSYGDEWGEGCKHQTPNTAETEEAFTRAGNVCYPNCMDPNRADNKIKADGFFPEKDSEGGLVAPEAWCSNQATGY